MLDEPSIGLHPRDIGRILGVMTRLRDAGNSLVVVEHDPQLMFAADRLLDMGPGRASGRRDRSSPPDEVAAMPDAHRRLPCRAASRWVDTRRQPRAVDAETPPHPARRCPAQPRRHRRGDSSRHRLVCVTGVSGSGKSTSSRMCSIRRWLRQLGKPTETPGLFALLDGHESLADVVMVDQRRSAERALQPGQLCRRLGRDPRLFAAPLKPKTRGTRRAPSASTPAAWPLPGPLPDLGL